MEAKIIANIMEDRDIEVFSVTHVFSGRYGDTYTVWGKYTSKEQLLNMSSDIKESVKIKTKARMAQVFKKRNNNEKTR